MGKKKEGWWIKLDYEWMRDEKIIDLRAKYGKAVLVDAVNTFILMAKCGGLADMSKPAHVEWARVYLGKTGKALYAVFDKLAEFGVIDPLMWEGFGHVTSDRAVADAQAVAKEKKANADRTAPARKRAEELRRKRASEASVTDSVTGSVTDPVTE